MMLSNTSKVFLSLMLILSTSACNEYWWTRGQAPSPSELLKKASSRVSETHSESSYKREEIYTVAKSIIDSISNSSEYSVETLSSVEENFRTLEGKLSFGNRAPFGELHGQLKNFINNKNKNANTEALTLYFARVLFFLSSEMKVPAPN